MTAKPCSMPDCGRPMVARGLCNAHYAQARRAARSGRGGWSRASGTTEQRFFAKVIKSPDGCWHWSSRTRYRGYAKFKADGRMVSAHRWSYEQFIGPIPEGLTVDHTCHNRDASCLGGEGCPHRACVNPEHLEVATRVENAERSGNYFGNRTHCPQGHPYDEENTFRTSKGGRGCRICYRASARATYYRRKARSG